MRKTIRYISSVIVVIILAWIVLALILDKEKINAIASKTGQTWLCGPLHDIDTDLWDHAVGVDTQRTTECYRAVALAKDDPSICIYRLDSYPDAECFIQFAHRRKDVQFCRYALSTYGGANCYRDLIKMGAADVSICDTIRADEPRQFGADTRNICRFGEYDDYMDPETCRKMEPSHTQDQCYQKFGLLD